ncbi:hypothetical protein PoB_005800100 [Plakobranchus ocellatus]|uniref:Uncharacterized protein n=1 Tax=Plakobranchus ocellatus TaxID=259542 RepID=A0AAV4C870_9GAST|nr:hypothetical protein PoB_005800100 [Plakobranchus ocellatus]
MVALALLVGQMIRGSNLNPGQDSCYPDSSSIRAKTVATLTPASTKRAAGESEVGEENNVLLMPYANIYQDLSPGFPTL